MQFLWWLVAVAGDLSPANTCKHTHRDTHCSDMRLLGKEAATQGPLIQQSCHIHMHALHTRFSTPSHFPAGLLLCVSLAFSHSPADAFLLLVAGLHQALTVSLPRLNPSLFLSCQSFHFTSFCLCNCHINLVFNKTSQPRM